MINGNCSIKFCKKTKIFVKNPFPMCSGHYMQYKDNKEFTELRERRKNFKEDEICSFPNCNNKPKVKNLCSGHDAQIKRGKTLEPLLYTFDSFLKRFWSYVDKTSDCWIWTGHLCTGGYGQIRYKGKYEMSHRVAWFLEYGEMPNFTMDHLCRNRKCVNPLHLQDVSLRDNVKNMFSYRDMVKEISRLKNIIKELGGQI